MFGNGSYATVWQVNDHERYADCRISTSRKKQDGEYETDFSAFVRFAGSAYEMSKELSERSRIKIISCAVSTKYDRERNVTYWNPVIFEFEHVENNYANKNNNPTTTKSSSDNNNNNNNNSFAGSDDNPFGDDDELPL